MHLHDLGGAGRRRAVPVLVLVLVLSVALLALLVGRGSAGAPRIAVVEALAITGVVVAVVATLAVALARRTRRRVAAVADATRLEQAAAAPLLARVPVPEDPTSLPALQPGDQAADPFGNLVLWWEAEAVRGPVGPVVISALATGPSFDAGGPGLGGTDAWWAANLAIALAGKGRSTLLVDGRMGDRFGSAAADAPDTPGLHDLLTGTSFDLALSPGPAPGLSVLPPGRVGREPDPAVLRTGFAAVAEKAGQRFDAVVVLAPALDQGDEAGTMAASGSLLLVVAEGTVGLTTVRSRAERVRAEGGRVGGVLLVEHRRPRRQR